MADRLCGRGTMRASEGNERRARSRTRRNTRGNEKEVESEYARDGTKKQEAQYFSHSVFFLLLELRRFSTTRHGITFIEDVQTCKRRQ